MYFIPIEMNIIKKIKKMKTIILLTILLQLVFVPIVSVENFDCVLIIKLVEKVCRQQ